MPNRRDVIKETKTRAELVRAIVWARVGAGVGFELGVSKNFLCPRNFFRGALAANFSTENFLYSPRHKGNLP